MRMVSYGISGILAGLLASCWNSFKDSPWEGFSFIKFIRSPILGLIAGMIFYYLTYTYNLPPIHKFGFLVLSLVTFERIFGEAYKGFFRKIHHVEFIKGFKFYHVEIIGKNYLLRIVSGISFIIFGWWLFISLSFYLFKTFFGLGLYTYSLIVGLVGGILIGFSGALKDVPWEGFKVKKFVRSPIAGIVGSLLLIFLSPKDMVYLLLAIPGIERIFVESYKSFWKERVRGIFEGKKPKFTEWFKKRKIFKAIFSFLVAITFLSFVV